MEEKWTAKTCSFLRAVPRLNWLPLNQITSRIVTLPWWNLGSHCPAVPFSFPGLRPALLFDNQSELRYFLKSGTISLHPRAPPPAPSSANSPSGPGEIQMHKATGEAGPVLSTPSFLVTGAATMHYPAVIDRVGLCRPGSRARLRWGPVALAPFHTTCREQEKLCWDCHFSTGQKFRFCAYGARVVYPKR